MPLLATDRPLITMLDPNPCVGVWMKVEGSLAQDYVWVIATSGCIAKLAGFALADQHNAVEIAKPHRTRIESAASHKYDAKGPDEADGLQEGQPILLVGPDDIPNV
jgi:hypothetical protein